ncbi:TetR/AcrR family transcriptional regulator [Achromobacter piechaudii]|uniref:Transcriptional regulator, TetR family n=1 Tax=Achromobacter piechaudii ATCC 43553 TaxID=742159 RepID=D4XF52_9BURK|nr:TetR/AcrR family transcriptional regulator [Achromobacter piechaudii]EFF74536.1 transcriptional regulator, TetR family [Achromobacter piechaudii ATCC 43553]
MSRTRAQMIEATRAKLLATARQAFERVGYAATSMDDLTAQAGLTRGALYHHFDDKKGLLAAVVEQIDDEMDQRLTDISDTAPDAWTALRERCRAYLRMATEPAIRRIVLQDAPAVLGAAPNAEPSQCITSMEALIQQLVEDQLINAVAPRALAHFINGGLTDSALWIASASEDEERLDAALHTLDSLLEGLRRR